MTDQPKIPRAAQGPGRDGAQATVAGLAGSAAALAIAANNDGEVGLMLGALAGAFLTGLLGGVANFARDREQEAKRSGRTSPWRILGFLG